MRKFKFRLESVLSYRRKLEEEAKNVYMEARSRRLDAEKGIDEIEQLQAEKLKQGFPSLNERLALQVWLDSMDDQRRHLEVAIEILQQEEEAARLAWVEARRESEALEKLKTSQKAEYDLELSRWEQNQLDEWATMRRKPA